MARQPAQEHLEDAIQHASISVDRDLHLEDFKMSKLKVYKAKDLYQFDDLSSWSEFREGDLVDLDEEEQWGELNSYRGSGFAHAAMEWIERGEVPTIVIVKTKEDMMIGDGRGRASVALGARLKVPAVILTENV